MWTGKVLIKNKYGHSQEWTAVWGLKAGTSVKLTWLCWPALKG